MKQPSNGRTVTVVLSDDGGGMQFPPEIFDEILNRIAAGKSLNSICKEDGFPSSQAVYKRIVKDKEFADRYNDARRSGFSVWADEVKDISDTTQTGVRRTTKETDKGTFVEITESDMTDHRRLQVDSRKWLLARLDQNRFGDKTLHGSDPDNPVTVAIKQYTIPSN